MGECGGEHFAQPAAYAAVAGGVDGAGVPPVAVAAPLPAAAAVAVGSFAFDFGEHDFGGRTLAFGDGDLALGDLGFFGLAEEGDGEE